MNTPKETLNTPSNTFQPKYKSTETKALLLMGLLLACGCVFDYQSARGIPLHPVNNLDGFSQVLLQIQGTVASLTISVIALLSGNIRDSVLGVSLTDYYLNKRPWIFKHRRVIVWSLLLLIANVLLHTWACYNLVLCVFVASFIPVLISILELYGVFHGRYSVNREIEQYVKTVFAERGNDTGRHALLEALTDDLTGEAKENAIEYEQYVQIYLYACRQLLELEDGGDGKKEDNGREKENNSRREGEVDSRRDLQESVSVIRKTGRKWIHSLFLSKDPPQIQRGFAFLNELYYMMWEISGRLEETGERIDFQLFRDVYEEAVTSLKRLPAEEAQECLQLPQLVYCVGMIAVYSPKGTYQNRELESLNRFMINTGWYLRQCRDKNDIYQEIVWGELLDYPYVFRLYMECLRGAGAQNEEGFHRAIWIPTRLLFNYYFGLLMNRIHGAIRDRFYKECLPQLGIFEKQSQQGDAAFKGEAFLAMSAYGYLYYTAKRAYESSVPEDIRAGAVQLLEGSDLREGLTKFLERLYQRNGILSQEFEHELELFLSQYEQHSHKAGEGILLCGEAAREAFLFLMAYLSWRNHDTELLDRVLDMDLYQTYISDDQEGHTKNLFSQMAVSVGYEWEEEERRNTKGDYEKQQAENVYQYLKTWLMKKLKQQEKERAARDQAAYEAENKEESLCGEISRLAEKRLYDEFAVILKQREGGAVLPKEEEQPEERRQEAWEPQEKTEKKLSEANVLEQKSAEERQTANMDPQAESQESEDQQPEGQDQQPEAQDQKSEAQDQQPEDSEPWPENQEPVIIKLLQYENFTRFLHDRNFIKNCISHVPGGFIWELCQELKNRRSIFWVNRKQFFASDKEYVEWLKRENIRILLGREYSLKNHDFRENDRFREITKDCTCIYVADALAGLALKDDALEVEITKVYTRIRPLSWEEIERQASYKEETGRYEYKMYGQNTIEFDKDELIEYLQSKRRVVEIYADVFIRKKEDCVGAALV